MEMGQLPELLYRTAPEGVLRYPPLPFGLIVYAVGDIHGRPDLLDEVHRRIDADPAGGIATRKIEIYLGDYVDRGPDPAGVIRRLLARSQCRYTVFLKGNHEAILEGFCNGSVSLSKWRRLGGTSTILSYDVDLPALLKAGRDASEVFLSRFPVSHARFLAGLRSMMSLGSYLFVHAGVRPGVAIDRQSTEDLLWIRDDFLRHTENFGLIVVHGHTPMLEPEFLSNRINIDTGAYATNNLTCIRIDRRGVTWLK